MATGKRSVSITIAAVDEASKIIANIGTKALPDLAKRVAGFAAGVASVATVFEVIGTAVHAALDAEQVTEKLTAALEAQKLSVASYLPHLESYAVSLSRVTKATDEQVKSAQQLLISVGGLSGNALDKATVAALNLAAGLGIDLNDAAMKIAKAANGSTREFSRLGVKFSDTASDGEKLARVMDFIEQRFGGAAQSEVTTLTGKIDLLKKSWDELTEAIAMQATGNKQVPGALDAISATLNLITDSVEKGRLREALGIVTSIGSALSGNVDVTFWKQLFDAVEHLKMMDLSSIRLAGKFPEEADPVLDKLKLEMDALIERNAKLAASTDKTREAYEKLTGIKMPQMPGSPVAPVAAQRPGPTLDPAADPTRFGLASPRAKAAPFVVPVKVEVDLPKVENDWALKIYESAKKAKAEAEALQATLDRFNANTETRVIAPKKAEPKTPITGPGSDFVIKGIVDDANAAAALEERLTALRAVEIALTAPIHDVAEAWGKVKAAVRTVADVMPDDKKAGAGGVNELLQKLDIATQRAVEAHATGGATEIQANVEAASALSDLLAAMHLPPELQAQLEALLSGTLAIGEAQEQNTEITTAAQQQQQILLDAIGQGATQLAGLMIDAATGAKVAWGEAIKSLLIGIAKAIIQQEILIALQAITFFSKGGVVGGGGGSAVASMMSKGGEVKPTYASQGAAIATPIYAAGGAAPVASMMRYLADGGPKFQPRGTDTVPAMLTPGEIVISAPDSKKLLSGQVTITAGNAAGPAARKIIGGRLAVMPASPVGAAAMTASQITIRAPKGAHGVATFAGGGLVAHLFAASGTVAPAMLAPAFATAAPIALALARMSRMPAAMMMPDSVALEVPSMGHSRAATGRRVSDGSTQDGGGSHASASQARNVTVNISALDSRSFSDALKSNSDAVVDVLDYIDSRRR